jgi:lysine-specific demethylase 8
MTNLLTTVLKHIDIKSISDALRDIVKMAECEEVALVSIQASKVIQFERDDLVSLKEGFDLVTALSFVVWERLHTGHWKDVVEGWRKLFTMLSLIKTILLAKLNAQLAPRVGLDKYELERDVVKICDVALLMGMPMLDNACASLAAAICFKCREPLAAIEERESERERKRRRTDVSCAGAASSADRIFEPSLELFVSEYRDKAQPVIMEGLMRDWPAMEKWSPEYLRVAHGMRTVPVELGTRYTDGDWTQTLMTLKEFIDG